MLPVIRMLMAAAKSGKRLLPGAARLMGRIASKSTKVVGRGARLAARAGKSVVMNEGI